MGRAGLRADDHGVTLPELLVVVSLLGLLAVTVAFSVRSINDDATKSVCGTEYALIERVVILWQRDSDGRLPSGQDLVDAGYFRSPPESFGIDPSGRITPLAGGPCVGFPVSDEIAVDGSGSGAGGSGGGSSDNAGPPSSASVEVSVAWTGNADLDLWVRTPHGQVIGWSSGGGGPFQGDIVPADPSAVGPHVERAMWSAGTAPQGEYTAWVAFNTDGWGDPPSTFVLSVRRGDDVVASLEGPVGASPGFSDALVASVNG